MWYSGGDDCLLKQGTAVGTGKGNLKEEHFGNRTAQSELVMLVGDETVCVCGGACVGVGLCSRMMLGAWLGWPES